MSLGDRVISQREFAELVGIGEPAVSDLVHRGILKSNVSGHGWLLAYCSHLREHAAGRAGPQSEARAALDNERRIEIAMRNAIKRREYAPVGLLAEVLASVGRQAVGILDGVVPALRLRFPELTAEQLKIVEGELVRARNVVAETSLSKAMADREKPAGDDE